MQNTFRTGPYEGFYNKEQGQYCKHNVCAAQNHQQHPFYQTSPCSQPSKSTVVSSVRKFLSSTLVSGGVRQQGQQYQQNQYHHVQQPQHHFSNYGTPCSQSSTLRDSSELEEVGFPLFKLCNFGVWKGPELGRGYSGVVHRGVGVLLNENENDIKDSRPMALKLSKPRAVHFSHDAFGTPGREFETLKFLYRHRVPVPRPLGFCVSSDDLGNGRTLLVMELVDGQTLREWINIQTDLVLRHNSSGRTLHPARKPQTAIERLDIAIGLIEALQRLHPFGVFVDLKPRNIMIGRQKLWTQGTGENVYYDGESNNDVHRHHWSRLAYPVTLVDIGGVVLRKDIQRNGGSKSAAPTSRSQDANSNSPNGNEQCSTAKNGWTKGSLPSSDPSTLPSLLGSFSKSDATNDNLNISNQDDSQLTCETPTIRPSQTLVSGSIFSDNRIDELKKILPPEDNSSEELSFLPAIHRHLLETTCSYLSPELATIVVESDRHRESISHHFHLCLQERLALHDANMKAKSQLIRQNLDTSIPPHHSQILPQNEQNNQQEREENNTQPKNHKTNGWLTEALVTRQLAASSACAFDCDVFECQDQDSILDDDKNQDQVIGLCHSQLKTKLLLEEYEETLDQLKHENVLQQIRTQDSNSKTSAEGDWIVELGQKSSIFSLGLIFVELFGGLRTGLTALCHNPIVASWFSKDCAYDIARAEHNGKRAELINACNKNDVGDLYSCYSLNSTTTRESPETKGSLEDIDDDLMLPSLSPFSGHSDRRVDCEFRIALEWETNKIPLVNSNNTMQKSSSFNLFDLRALREVRESKRKQTRIEKSIQRVPDRFEDIENLNPSQSKVEKEINDESRQNSLIHSTPSIEIPSQRFQDDGMSRNQPLSSETVFGSSFVGPSIQLKKDGQKSVEQKNGASIAMTSFKELYKQYCYPVEGCFTSEWKFKYKKDDSSDSDSHENNHRVLILPVGQLAKKILDLCFEQNPKRRPTYAVLKRMLHGLRLLYWNIQNGKIGNEWKQAGCPIIKNIKIKIDELGYIEAEGWENCVKKRLLRSISRKIECASENQPLWELILDINFKI